VPHRPRRIADGKADIPLPPSPLPTWNIYLATSTPAKFVGTVEAPDADAAIAKAIEEFHIEPQRAQRLIAVRRAP
jgi:hypothetical protein